MNTDSTQSPQVDFYLLSDQENEPFNVACRLTEKAFHAGFTVFVYTTNRSEADQMNQLLWSFRADSFIPHRLVTPDTNDTPADRHDQITPVLVGYELPATCHCIVLINLTNKAITHNTTFKRICHVIPGDDESRTIARQAFIAYKNINIRPNIIGI